MDSLRYMAEQVEGSFAFSVLDAKNNLYIVKGDNPICLVHFPQSKLYLYASTKEILAKALGKIQLPNETPIGLPLDYDDILRIDAAGKRDESTFDAAHLLWIWDGRGWVALPYSSSSYVEDLLEPGETYLEELKAVAAMFGFGGEPIDRLLCQGFSTDEIEEALYCCGER